MSTNEDFPGPLIEVFQYIPETIVSSAIPRFYGLLPFDFYDRHLAPEMALQRVIIDSSIPTKLATNIDATLKDFRSQGYESLPLNFETAVDCMHPDFYNHPHSPSASKLAMRYLSAIGDFSAAFISRWAVHPTATKYYSSLSFCPGDEDFPKYREYVHSRESLRFRLFNSQRPEVLSFISDQIKDAIKSLEFKDLVIYQFFHRSTVMEQIFKDMDLLGTSLPSAAYQTGGLVDKKAERKPAPCDATSSPWTIPNNGIQDTRGSIAIQQLGEKKITFHSDATEIRFDQADIPTAAGLCYHAWNEAVRKDATIIVFHCGNYERIGIRHRATQTLILSSLIEVPKCRNPPYGKVHVGLMLAAVQDALDRHAQSYSPQPVDISPPGKGKRGRVDPNELRRSKRQKVKSQMAPFLKTPSHVKNDDKLFWKLLGQRPIALVYLDFDAQKSTSPSACLRIGDPLSPHGIERGLMRPQESYDPSECCLLTFVSDLSNGATGRVHAARLDVKMVDGTTHSKDVIVKAAVEPRLRARVRREYDAYLRLWENNVQRIPRVYGLFHDADDMVTFLVIEKFEMSFRDREPIDVQDKGKMLNVTRIERSLCLKTIRAIHKAGVIHMDMRAENIMVGKDGLPVIIDFDRSWVGENKNVMDKEIGFVQDLLDGKVHDGFPIAVESDEE